MFAVLLAALVQPAACHAIDTDRIYARDLAAALPLFASLPPDIEAGFAPVPGQKRVFHPPELRRLAQANHLTGEISADVCFAWPMAIPSRESILAAMNDTLKGRKVSIEILDQGLSPAPKGQLEFPLSGLCGFSAEPVIWRGYIVYARQSAFLYLGSCPRFGKGIASDCRGSASGRRGGSRKSATRRQL